VDVGGEPERDDFGLPPVDIQVPDDARELERDMQAYHRELRAERRHRRARRLGGPLARNGMVLPLLAGCLVLALVSGTLLTLFSAGQNGLPGLPGRLAASQPDTARAKAGSPTAGPAVTSQLATGQLPAGISGPRHPATGSAVTGRPASGALAAGPNAVGGLLPDQTVEVAGRVTPLRSLGPAVLALVPLACGCGRAVQQLVRQAAKAHVALYLVATAAGMAQLGRLSAGTGQRRTAQVAEDASNILGRTYQPAGLTAILVHADGSVAQVATRLRAPVQLTPQFRQLSPAPQPTP
jgi:hypothetical protein